MITYLLAAAIAAGPAPAPSPGPAPHKDHAGHGSAKHDMPCCDETAKKDCCKGGQPMPCCAKDGDKPAEAPVAESGAGHDHDH